MKKGGWEESEAATPTGQATTFLNMSVILIYKLQDAGNYPWKVKDVWK